MKVAKGSAVLKASDASSPLAISAFSNFKRLDANLGNINKLLGAASAVASIQGNVEKALGAASALSSAHSDIDKMLSASLPVNGFPDSIGKLVSTAFPLKEIQDSIGKLLSAALPINEFADSIGKTWGAIGALSANQIYVGKMLGTPSAANSIFGKTFSAKVNQSAMMALKAHESTSLLKLLLPKQDWLDIASRHISQSQLPVSIKDLQGVSDRIALEATRAAGLNLKSNIAEKIIGNGLDAWSALVNATPLLPSPNVLERLALGSSGTLSIVESGSVIAGDLDYERFSEDPYVVLDFGQLRSCLAKLGPRIVTRWDGARERVQHPGPDAASQAAHSLVELIDQSLRQGAPDGHVLKWHLSEGRPLAELHQAGPTRALRIRYLVRDRPEDSESVEIIIRCLLDLMGFLQKKKHGDGDDERLAIQRLIPGIGSMLYYIFGYK